MAKVEAFLEICMSKNLAQDGVVVSDFLAFNKTLKLPKPVDLNSLGWFGQRVLPNVAAP